MDLNNLLSIMGNGNNNSKELLSALSMLNGKNGLGSQANADMLTSIIGDGNKNNADMLASLLGGGNPDISKLMGLYNNRKPKGLGLKPISAFASDEILGILLKYFL